MTTYAAPEQTMAAGPAIGAADAAVGCAGAVDAAAGAAGGGTGGGGGGVPPHRLLDVARELETVVAGVARVPVWSMSAGEQAEALLVLDRAASRLAELNLRVLAAADRNGVGVEAGATSTAA